MFSSFEFSKSAMTRCADEIRRFRPLTVIGYTNSLCLLAQHILEQKLSVPSPNAVITAAEGVNSVQRELLQQAFGAPVFVSYGSREFMLIGMECEQHNGLHLSVDNLLIEVVRADGTPAADGEAGEIILTDLHNYAMPFIRYKIGDMGVATSRACPCGRGLPLLERVEGRVLDVIRTPDGRILPGEFFPHLMKEFSAIKQFQVIQKELRSLEIKLVLRETPATEQLERLRQEVQKALGNTIQTKYIIVTEIPQTASGKFRVTVSELPQA
jgi:phenylacetate-CoA ligase